MTAAMAVSVIPCAADAIDPDSASAAPAKRRPMKIGMGDLRWDKSPILIQTVRLKQRPTMIESPYLLFLGAAPDLAPGNRGRTRHHRRAAALGAEGRTAGRRAHGRGRARARARR